MEFLTRIRERWLRRTRGSDALFGRGIGAAVVIPRISDLRPIRTVLLRQSGMPVLVPSPERYAVHELTVAPRRQADASGVAKREMDVGQARFLAEALDAARRLDDFARSQSTGRRQH